MNDYLVSVIRTVVPAVVAAALTWLASRWLLGVPTAPSYGAATDPG